MNSKCSTKESLFVCARSNEPFSILTVDPVSGTNCFAFQGNEPQNGTINFATFSHDQTHLYVAMTDKSIITFPLKLKKSRRTLSFSNCTRSVFSQKVNFIVSHPSGDFIFIASDNKIFAFEVKLGNILSIVEDHIREISVLRISACGSLLASSSIDGAVKIWLTASLISRYNGESRIRPQLGGYSTHTLEVNDLHITSGINARIFSVSADHSACLYSLATNQILLKITSDHPLSACCMDGAERRLFLASTDGQIRMIDLMNSKLPKDSFQKMTVNNEQNDGNNVNSFHFHNCRVQQLCTNSDGSRLASGDSSGTYAIWDAANGQLLQNGQMKGPISVLSFILENMSAAGNSLPALDRQMTLGPRSNVAIKHVSDNNVLEEKQLKDHFSKVLQKINARTLRCELSPSNSPTESSSKDVKNSNNKSNQNKSRKRRRIEPTENLSKGEENGSSVNVMSNESATTIDQLQRRVRGLEKELARVVQINAEIYDYAANLTIEEDVIT